MTATTPTAAERASARRGPSLPWIAAGVIAVAVILSALLTVSGARLPLYWQDEAGYLTNAQVMSGVGHVPQLSGRPYSLGWSLLLVPLWWILRDGPSVYLGAVVLSALVGIAVTVPLTLIARRLGLSLPMAIVVSGCLALASARTLYAGFAMSENFLTLLVVVAVLLAMRLSERQTIGRVAALGAVSSLAFVTHGRALPLVVATALWMLVLLRRRPLVAAVGLVVTGAVATAGYLLYKHVTTLIYGPSSSRESIGVSRVFRSDPLATLVSGLGQTWYVAFAWLGLTILGVVLLARAVQRETSVRRPGVAVWSALVLIGVATISFTFISGAIARGSSRLDIYSYGRYLDPFVVPLALAGLVLVTRVLSKRLAWGLVVAMAAIAILWFAIVYPRLPSTGPQLWFPINITGTLQFPWRGTTYLPAAPWAYLSLFGVAAAVVIALLRKRPAILIALLAVYFLASTVVAQERIIRPFFSGWETSFTLRQTIATDPILRGAPVSLDTSGLRDIGDTVSQNGYGVLLAPTEVDVFDSDTGAPPTELVIARQKWDGAAALGAVKVANDTGMFSNALWVLPGTLMDRLEKSGAIPAN